MKASGWKFGWKRKLGEKVSRTASETFENESKGDVSNELMDEEIDWLTMAPLRKNLKLEDATSKSIRLKDEGSVLAESERYWEAIKKWDEALSFTPNDETLYEMKAQVLLILCELYPAVKIAQKAVQIKPNWWVGLQTLGRAQLGLGEVHLAVKTFSRACHLNPDISELWEEDLQWARTLLHRKQNLIVEEEQDEQRNKLTITELEDVEVIENCDDIDNSCSVVKSDKNNDDVLQTCSYVGQTTKLKHLGDNNETSSETLKKLPRNYVLMRNT